MKVAYIAHPISGDVSGNLKKIEAIAREINLNEPDVVPFAPYFLDCHCLDDTIPEERERGIRNDVALLKKGFVDELRLYGDRISNGMKEEIKLAIELSINIKPMNEVLRNQLGHLFYMLAEFFKMEIQKSMPDSKDKLTLKLHDGEITFSEYLTEYGKIINPSSD